jgi:hypothetical protein
MKHPISDKLNSVLRQKYYKEAKFGQSMDRLFKQNNFQTFLFSHLFWQILFGSTFWHLCLE